MELKVIGTGSSGNSYALTHNNSMLLLDAGVSVNDIYAAVNYNMANLNGALISHHHLRPF